MLIVADNMRKESFNFTRIPRIEEYNDSIEPAADPKVKGFFVLLMVKPNLNLKRSMQSLIDNKRNILPGQETTYSDHTQAAKLFRGALNPYIMENLTHSYGSYFSSIISKKAISVSYPDIGSNSEEILSTIDRSMYKLPITETGHSGGNFQISFRENEAMDVLRMISVWHKYIHAITRGNISPSIYSVKYSIIDYKASLYIIHLKPDFKTITMWSKYTGIYPNNVPLSAMSEDITSVSDVTLNVDFSYDKFEWMNEDILRELNLLTLNANIDVTTLTTTNLQPLANATPTLIKKIKNSPFYHIDLNGLNDYYLNNRNAHTYAQFGNSYTNWNNISFAAPLTEEMIYAMTNYESTDSTKINKNVPKRYV